MRQKKDRSVRNEMRKERKEENRDSSDKHAGEENAKRQKKSKNKNRFKISLISRRRSKHKLCYKNPDHKNPRRTNVVFAKINVLQRRVEFERVRQLANGGALLLPLGGLGLKCGIECTREVSATGCEQKGRALRIRWLSQLCVFKKNTVDIMCLILDVIRACATETKIVNLCELKGGATSGLGVSATRWETE